MQIGELPKPSVLQCTIGELELGTYDQIETATPETRIIDALDKFVNRRISALPIVDQDGKLMDIYAKFDVIVSTFVFYYEYFRYCEYVTVN